MEKKDVQKKQSQTTGYKYKFVAGFVGAPTTNPCGTPEKSFFKGMS